MSRIIRVIASLGTIAAALVAYEGTGSKWAAGGVVLLSAVVAAGVEELLKRPKPLLNSQTAAVRSPVAASIPVVEPWSPWKQFAIGMALCTVCLLDFLAPIKHPTMAISLAPLFLDNGEPNPIFFRDNPGPVEATLSLLFGVVGVLVLLHFWAHKTSNISIRPQSS